MFTIWRRLVVQFPVTSQGEPSVFSSVFKGRSAALAATIFSHGLLATFYRGLQPSSSSNSNTTSSSTGIMSAAACSARRTPLSEDTPLNMAPVNSISQPRFARILPDVKLPPPID